MTEYGFLRVGAAVPNVRVADVDYNLNGLIEIVKDADHKECDVVVFPEMSVTGYTCADLFMQPLLMDAAAEAISELARETAEYQIMIAVGAPVIAHGRRYNCAIRGQRWAWRSAKIFGCPIRRAHRYVLEVPI